MSCRLPPFKRGPICDKDSNGYYIIDHIHFSIMKRLQWTNIADLCSVQSVKQKYLKHQTFCSFKGFFLINNYGKLTTY